MNNRYKFWLENATKEIKEEISKYNDLEIEECFSNDLEFGTAGVRGPIKYGTSYINEITIAKIAWAYGKFLLEKDEEKTKKYGVLIAHDNRRNRILFSETTAKVLGGLGIPTYFFKNNELQPTPFVSYIINKYNYVGGVIITASHNPPTDNGFKVYDENGTQLLPSSTERIQEIASELENPFNIVFNEEKINYLDDSVEEEYLDEIMNQVPFNKEYLDRSDLKITFTSQHGTAYKFAPILAKKMGVTMYCVEEQCNPDENFSNTKSPNPQNPVAFELAKKIGEENGSELLFSTDPDSDRFGLVVKHNDEWVHITGNELPVMQLYWILTKLKENDLLNNKMCAIRSIVSSSMADRIAKEFGIEIFTTLTGFKWIVSKSLEKGKEGYETIFSWEEAYGSVIKQFSHDKDAFQAFVQVIEMAYELKKKDMTFVDLMNQMYEKYGKFIMEQDSYRFEGIKGKNTMNQFINDFSELKVGDQFASKEITKLMDFSKGYEDFPLQNLIIIELENHSRILLRPSGTEPILRIYFDLVDIDITEVKKEISKYIDKYL